MTALKAIGMWFLILGLAVANGGLREAVLLQALPRPAAFTLSGIILIACIFGVAALLVPWLGPLDAWRYALIGLLWLPLTVALEFAIGVWLRGETVTSLLEAYKFKHGNIWPLVLLAVAAAPLTAARLRRLI